MAHTDMLWRGPSRLHSIYLGMPTTHGMRLACCARPAFLAAPVLWRVWVRRG